MNDNNNDGAAPYAEGAVLLNMRDTINVLTGVALNSAQYDRICVEGAKLDDTVGTAENYTLPIQPFGIHPFDYEFASEWGDYYRDAGCAVANAVLRPRRFGRIHGSYGFYKEIEPSTDAQVGFAAQLISGVVAEDYATGSLHYHPFGLAAFAWIAVCLAKVNNGDPASEVLNVLDIVASTLGLNWEVVEQVAAAKLDGRSPSDLLLRVTGTMTIDGDPRMSKHKAGIRRYMAKTFGDVIGLARDLRELGEADK